MYVLIDAVRLLDTQESNSKICSSITKGLVDLSAQ